MPVRRVCQECGSEFFKPPSEPGKFCSNTCRGRYHRGERAPRWQAERITLACPECGTEFVVRKAIAANSGAGHPRKYCSKACQTAYMRRENSPHWKGGRFMQGEYVYLNRPDHPNAAKNGIVGEHVVVASEKIGRPLLPGEVVHHVDGDKANNDPDNLRVMTNSDHMRYHRREHLSKRGKIATR